MEKSKLISIANLLTNTNTFYIPQVIRTTPRSQSLTASLSAYAVFAPKMNYFDSRSTELQQYQTKRGYKPRFIRGQISRLKLIPRNDTLKEKSHNIKKPIGVPFTVTYNPALPNINKNTAEETTHSQFNSTLTQNLQKKHLLWLIGVHQISVTY